MPTFSYKAIAGDGRQTAGVVTAPARDQAIDDLVGRGLHPVEIAAAAETTFGSNRRVSRAAVESFVRELANLLTAGVSLTRALEILGREAAQPAARRMWADIRADVADGAALADAMARFPRTFSPVQIAMVRASEQGGFLDQALTQIAELQSAEREILSRVRSAMIYPAFLCVMLVGVMVFLLTYFIPQFRSIFNDFGAALPPLTRFVLAVSDAMVAHGLVLLVAAALIIALLRRAWMRPAGRSAFDRAIMRMPGVGVATARFALVRFCRLLGTLIQSGVPLIVALRTARDALGSVTLTDAVDHAVDSVKSGESLARSLSACKQLFPAPVVETIAIAEETGRLDAELIRVADQYEKELNRRLTNLVAVIEPLMLLVMATIVGTIVVSMLLPIFTLQDLIN
jgi:type II secretory pathway component PulF